MKSSSEAKSEAQKKWHNRLESLRQHFGKDLLVKGDLDDYALNCEGLKRELGFVFVPRDVNGVSTFIRYCFDHQISFYPISRGHNWGYGSALPVESHCGILDLHRLCEIQLDEELGIVEIGPGVSPQNLFEYLKLKNLPWMVPLTGAGPYGSILGNALERGFGLNPIADHFTSLLSVKAILADGTIYKSRLSEMGAWKSDQVNKWKVGPYQEGLFSQSNLGVVIAVSIQLAPRPESVDLVMVKSKLKDLPKLVDVTRQLFIHFNGNLGGINISNKLRLDSTLEAKVRSRSGWAQWFVGALYRLLGVEIDEVQVVVPIYIPHRAYKNIGSDVRQHFRDQQFRTSIAKEKLLGRALKLKSFLNFELLSDIWRKIESAYDFTRLLKGIPSSFTLQLAYVHAPEKRVTDHLPKDGIGLYWFAPIVRFKSQDILESVQILEKVLPRHDQKVMWTFTVLSPVMAEATIPICFDVRNPIECERALACWDDLFNEFLKAGMSPYRYSINHMDRSKYKDPNLLALQDRLKKAFDEKGIIAPGRYLS